MLLDDYTLEHIESLANQGDIIAKFLVHLKLKSKYTLAAADPTVIHMRVDIDHVVQDPLPNNATLLQACLQANDLVTDQLLHYEDSGATIMNDASHLYVDTTNKATLQALTPLGQTSTLTDLINRIDALNSARLSHGSAKDQSGNFSVHFHDDAQENLENMTHNPPVILSDCITDLNDLRTFFLDHFGRGSQ